MEPQAYTVTALTRMIKTALEESFFDLWVEGEISGYLHHSSGHRYFSLKDENALIKVVIWRSAGTQLRFEPENGQHVRVYGNVGVYEKGGNYQLVCRQLVPVGVGPLELAFRQLHERLAKEGWFDEDRKRPLPEYPQTVGIVTSPTGAAIRDVIQIVHRRNPSLRLILYPAQVQGEGAEKSIADGVKYFNTREDIDLLIVGRGGGSLEDLWCFNTEIVVKAVAQSRHPVISAVGHEIDITLCDLAADLRAATPSAAAEIAAWSAEEFRDRLAARLTRAAQLLEHRVVQARQRLKLLRTRPVYTRPDDVILQRQQYLDSLTRLLLVAGKNRFEQTQNRLSLLRSRLEDLSPLGVLARGYSVTRRLVDGALVKAQNQVRVGDTIETLLADGSIRSRVESN